MCVLFDRSCTYTHTLARTRQGRWLCVRTSALSLFVLVCMSVCARARTRVHASLRYCVNVHVCVYARKWWWLVGGWGGLFDVVVLLVHFKGKPLMRILQSGGGGGGGGGGVSPGGGGV